jgi:hypothetical protein
VLNSRNELQLRQPFVADRFLFVTVRLVKRRRGSEGGWRKEPLFKNVLSDLRSVSGGSKDHPTTIHSIGGGWAAIGSAGTDW